MFDWLIRLSLHHRLAVLVLVILLALWGGWAAWHTPVDVFPDLNRPTVTVMTEAGGLAPEEVETLVSRPLEAAFGGLPGVLRVRSTSAAGLSLVFVEFDWGSDPFRNRQQVSERLGVVRERLPAGLNPQLGPLASIMGEIMLLALPVPAGSSPMVVRDFADWQLRPALLAIPGVAQVIPIGGEVRQLRIEPDPVRLRSSGVTLNDLAVALQGLGGVAAGGFVERQGQEWMLRATGRVDLRNLPLAAIEQQVVAIRQGTPIRLGEVARVREAAAVKRGDAGYQGEPAVIVSVQKQPGVDSLALTALVEARLDRLATQLPAGVAAPRILFRQADFIVRAVDNVQDALRDGAIMVAVVLYLFLASMRTTLISLLAIPVSLVVAMLVFRHFGLSINTMTLGGLAIAIGELVDDAVVDVENILRRLRQAAQSGPLEGAVRIREVVAAASSEVRSGVVYATLIVVLVFVPLFALPGIEGRLFAPLGVAYIVSILASLLVALTLTPVLATYWLPQLARRGHGDSRLADWLRQQQERVLAWLRPYASRVMGLAVILVLVAGGLLLQSPRSFLPAFNEGTLTVSLVLQPGTALAESNRIGRLAEQLIMQVPEVVQVGRRSGRAELDEHAEGVHASELDVALRGDGRSRNLVMADIRERLALLPASVAIGQPIAHRLDHLLSGVRAAVVIKLFGDDLDTLRGLAEGLRENLADISGLADLQVEKQQRVPQVRLVIDYSALARHGVAVGQVLDSIEALGSGRVLGQLVDEQRRIDVVLRLAEDWRQAEQLVRVPVDTPLGQIPLGELVRVDTVDGPNQIGRENGLRRIVISANVDGRIDDVVAAIQQRLAAQSWPAGYGVVLEGQFQAREEAAGRMLMLGTLSLVLIALVLYARYRSWCLAAIIMANIPLAMVGAVLALWLAGASLSLAALVGFITLAGIATRNGILKISHYINLCAYEGEVFGWPMVLRGSRERLLPVWMTALVAALALLPLVLAVDAPGKEILHPVALVIFGGLISSTLLDTLLTPLVFYRYGRPALERLVAQRSGEAY